MNLSEATGQSKASHYQLIRPKSLRLLVQTKTRRSPINLMSVSMAASVERDGLQRGALSVAEFVGWARGVELDQGSDQSAKQGFDTRKRQWTS